MKRLSADTKWFVLSGAAALASSSIVGALLSGAWERTTGRRAPANPASPHVSWRKAIAWALVTGAATSLASMIAERTAATAWKRTTGTLPRELRRRRV